MIHCHTKSILMRPVLLAALACLATPASAQDAPPPVPLALDWIGPSDSDMTSNDAFGVPNGVNDLAVAVDASSMITDSPVQWSLSASGRMAGALHYEWPATAGQNAALYVERSGREFILYFEPFLTVPGDAFTVMVTHANGATQTGRVYGSGLDWGERAFWRGQTSKDFTGDGLGGNGVNDWMIEVGADGQEARRAVEWRVWLDYRGTDDHFHAYWAWRADDPEDRTPGRMIFPRTDGAKAELYIDPVLAREGDRFAVQAVMDDGSSKAWTLAGGGSDWGETAVYLGRTDEDLLGEQAEKPNGINDIGIQVLDRKIASGGVVRCAVQSGPLRWEWPRNVDSDARYLSVEQRGGGVDLRFDQTEVAGGSIIFVSAVLRGGELIGWAVPASRTDTSPEATWLGQIADMVGSTDSPGPDGQSDLAIEVTHAKLAQSIVASWRVSGDGRLWSNDLDEDGAPVGSPVYVEDLPGSASRVVYFSEALEGGNEPIARGTAFTVTAVLEDGHTIHWRIASPGSPWVSGVRWLAPTRKHYVLQVDAPDFAPRAVRVRSERHQWRTEAADASMDKSRGGMTVRLSRGASELSPGQRLLLEFKDAAGVRSYGACFVGAVE